MIQGLNTERQTAKVGDKEKITKKIKRLEETKGKLEMIVSELKKVGKGDLIIIDRLFTSFANEVRLAIKEKDLGLNEELGETFVANFRSRIREMNSFFVVQEAVITDIFNRTKKFSQAQQDTIEGIYQQATGTGLERGLIFNEPVDLGGELVSTLLRVEEEVTKLERSKEIMKDATKEYEKIMKKIIKLESAIKTLPERFQGRLLKDMPNLKQEIHDFGAKFRGGEERFSPMSEEDATKFLQKVINVEKLIQQYDETNKKYENANHALDEVKTRFGTKDARVKKYQKQINEAATAGDLERIIDEISFMLKPTSEQG